MGTKEDLVICQSEDPGVGSSNHLTHSLLICGEVKAQREWFLQGQPQPHQLSLFWFGGVLKEQVQKVGLWKKGYNKFWTLERRADLLHAAGASPGSASPGPASAGSAAVTA